MAMAHQRNETSLFLMLVMTMTITLLWGGATAQSSSCTNVIISMSPCLNYITGNSSSPSSGCCTQLASVVNTQPQCLCQVLNGGGSSLGLNINQTQAAALPGACRIQTPPLSQCSAASPSGTPSSPSGGGTPSTNNGGGSPSSDASSTKLATPALIFFLVLVSSALTSTMF